METNDYAYIAIILRKGKYGFRVDSSLILLKDRIEKECEINFNNCGVIGYYKALKGNNGVNAIGKFIKKLNAEKTSLEKIVEVKGVSLLDA